MLLREGRAEDCHDRVKRLGGVPGFIMCDFNEAMIFNRKLLRKESYAFKNQEHIHLSRW